MSDPDRRLPREPCENHSVHIGQPLIRGLRALVFAVACVTVTAALHFIASGSLICFETFAIAVAVLTFASGVDYVVRYGVKAWRHPRNPPR